MKEVATIILCVFLVFALTVCGVAVVNIGALIEEEYAEHYFMGEAGSAVSEITIYHRESGSELNGCSFLISLSEFDGMKLEAVVSQGEETDKPQEIKWSSSNPKAATVDDQGNVSFLHTGATLIKASNGFGSRKTASFEIILKTNPGSPDFMYVPHEADRVADSILSKAGKNSINLILGADMHNMGDGESSYQKVVNQIRESNQHAGQAMALIADEVDVDILAILGDITWGSNTTTIDQGTQGINLAKEYLTDAMSKSKYSVMLSGNHDYMYGSSAFSDYHYKDYSDKKVRAIFLNTTDGGSENISAEQLQWFADSLDLSEKEDAADWGIIILSHHPLDWGNIIHAANVLQAYLSGSSYSVIHNGAQVSCDFAGKNAATVIAQFHGNTHCLKVDYIHYMSDGIAVPLEIQRIAIPNACFQRNNEYGQNNRTESHGIEFGESTTYKKTASTAQDTSFCVVSIDLDLKEIYVDCYGAGYDRVIHYGRN